MPTLSVLPDDSGELPLGLVQDGDDVSLVDNFGNTIVTVKNGGGHPEFARHALSSLEVGGGASYEVDVINGNSVVKIHD